MPEHRLREILRAFLTGGVAAVLQGAPSGGACYKKDCL
jgi:hypothetical protein